MFHDVVFAQNVAIVLHEHEQDVEDLGPEWYDLAISYQLAVACIDSEGSELVRRFDLTEHWLTGSFPNFFLNHEGLQAALGRILQQPNLKEINYDRR